MARANVPRFFLVQFLGLWSLQLLEPSGPRTPFPPSAVRPWPDATPLLPEDHADFIAPLVFGHVVRLANSTVRPSAETVGSAFEASRRRLVERLRRHYDNGCDC
ncbi:hypothetical protein MRX96_042501 [Rhipicephalus microplus]